MGSTRIDRRSRGILSLTLALICVPVLIDLAVSGPAAPFRYFAADAFYYLSVARNWVEIGLPSFDHVHPTNGFHPLWQALLTGLLVATRAVGLSEVAYLRAVVVLCLLCTAGGVALLGAAYARARGALPAWFTLFPVGLYALAIAPVWFATVDIRGLENVLVGPMPLYGTLWSFVNGMESGLLLLCLGLLFWVFLRPSQSEVLSAGVVGLASSALVLSRLDHVFIPMGVGLIYAVDFLVRRDGKSFASVLIFSAALGLPIAAYLAINLSYAGTPFPISGQAKSTFPNVTASSFANAAKVVRDLFMNWDARWLSRFYRAAQLFVPLAVGVAALVMIRAPLRKLHASGSERFDLLLVAVAFGAVLIGAYNLLFVATFAMGHWYFPVSILLVSLIGLRLFEHRMQIGTARVALIGSLVCVLVFVGLHRRPEYNQGFVDFYFDEAPKVRAFYAGRPPHIIEFDDGIVAYSTGFPALSGIGLVLDLEAHQHMRDGTFPELALRRGFDRATSVVYQNFAAPDGLKATGGAGYLAKWPVEASLEYASGSESFGIVRLRLRRLVPRGRAHFP